MMVEIIKKVDFPRNPVLKSFTLKTYSYDDSIYGSHGSPCSIILEPVNGDGIFWKAANAVNETLNKTPDDFERNPSEFSQRELDAKTDMCGRISYGNRSFQPGQHRGGHTLAGGDNAYIDAIAPADATNVAAKALRKLHEDGVIDQRELKQAYDALDLPQATLTFVKNSRAAAGVGR